MSSDTVPRHLTRAHMESALEEVIAAGPVVNHWAILRQPLSSEPDGQWLFSTDHGYEWDYFASRRTTEQALRDRLVELVSTQDVNHYVWERADALNGHADLREGLQPAECVVGLLVLPDRPHGPASEQRRACHLMVFRESPIDPSAGASFYEVPSDCEDRLREIVAAGESTFKVDASISQELVGLARERCSADDALASQLRMHSDAIQKADGNTAVVIPVVCVPYLHDGYCIQEFALPGSEFRLSATNGAEKQPARLPSRPPLSLFLGVDGIGLPDSPVTIWLRYSLSGLAESEAERFSDTWCGSGWVESYDLSDAEAVVQGAAESLLEALQQTQGTERAHPNNHVSLVDQVEVACDVLREHQEMMAADYLEDCLYGLRLADGTALSVGDYGQEDLERRAYAKMRLSYVTARAWLVSAALLRIAETSPPQASRALVFDEYDYAVVMDALEAVAQEQTITYDTPELQAWQSNVRELMAEMDVPRPTDGPVTLQTNAARVGQIAARLTQVSNPTELGLVDMDCPEWIEEIAEEMCDQSNPMNALDSIGGWQWQAVGIRRLGEQESTCPQLVANTHASTHALVLYPPPEGAGLLYQQACDEWADVLRGHGWDARVAHLGDRPDVGACARCGCPIMQEFVLDAPETTCPNCGETQEPPEDISPELAAQQVVIVETDSVEDLVAAAIRATKPFEAWLATYLSQLPPATRKS